MCGKLDILVQNSSLSSVILPKKLSWIHWQRQYFIHIYTFANESNSAFSAELLMKVNCFGLIYPISHTFRALYNFYLEAKLLQKVQKLKS